MKTIFSIHNIAALTAFFGATLSARAATLKAAPASPQPGDILTLTIYPATGEKLSGIGMAAYDTKQVKFYMRPDGSARAFLGLPFDRHAGTTTLSARVEVEKNGATAEQIIRTRVLARERNFPTQRISMKSSTAGTMSKKGALRAEKAIVQAAMSDSYPAPLWRGSWVMPARGASTSAYGRRRYVNGKWWGQHNGADIKAGTGTPVRAINSGRVVLSQYLPTLRGNCIIVDHGCNVFSVYMHLSQRGVKVGQSVSRGQQIGKVGATGFVTGPHLHFEARIAQEPSDPFKLIARGLQF